MRLQTWLSALSVALLTPIACGGGATQTAEPTLTGGGGSDIKPDTDVKEPVVTKTVVELFADECRSGLASAKSQLPGLLAVEGARTEDNFLVPYNKLLDSLMESAGTAELMAAVHPNKDVRTEAGKCQEDISKFGSKLSRDKGLFKAFSALDTKALDANGKRLVKHALRDFRRAGIDKDDKTRARLAEIENKLTSLSNSFAKNILEDVKEIKVSLDELKGLPKDWIKAHPVGEDGLITVTTNYPDYISFNNYAESTARRRELYLLFRSRGGEANEKILRDVLTLRAEKAGLLGYANWADYVTEDKMVKSGKNAKNFIAKVIKSSRSKAKKDYKELLTYKRKNIDRKARLVEDFEKSFIENKLKATKYKFDSQAVRPYFAYNKVEAGLLDITGEVFGIRYEPVKGAKVWHKTVKAFDVFRKSDSEKLGRIYLDMHPRDGKYKHAAQFPYRAGVKGVRLPEGVLVCNFPSGDELMEHAQVETMFHEFGHLMHHTLGGHQKWIEQSGVATEWDFVEAPSQMFEEWANSHETLSRFAKHNETGEVISKDLVNAMRKASAFGTGTNALQQMFYASISLGFHTADPAKLDMRAEVKKLQNKITPFRYLDGTMFHTSFGHLMGYSAIYYTYMWSEVIAKDLLTPFKKKGLMDPTLTAKYRDLVLVPGGTKDAADLVKDFLGRDFNYKAFERYLAGK